jgi:hypothetical protein
VVQSYTIWDEDGSPLTPRKYVVLNGNFVVDLRDVFQERNPGVKRELPACRSQSYMFVQCSVGLK